MLSLEFLRCDQLTCCEDLYGLSPGVAGLAFLPSMLNQMKKSRRLLNSDYFTTVSVGAVFAFSLFMLYTSYHTKAVNANKEWASVEEYRRLPLAAVGAPL